MKSFLIIGMGRFGHHITINLARQGAEIMIVDTDQRQDGGSRFLLSQVPRLAIVPTRRY